MMALQDEPTALAPSVPNGHVVSDFSFRVVVPLDSDHGFARVANGSPRVLRASYVPAVEAPFGIQNPVILARVAPSWCNHRVSATLVA
jgi:hypothetical protein